MIKIIGWIGTQLLAWCALPAVIQVVSQGHAEGYNFWFISMWGLGELLTAIYVYMKHGLDKPLLFNYGINLAFIIIIMYYKI
ncbi:MAG: hypothetical protein COB41_00620 [Proteobacteria bacterium]|nr:MAG: hypothetical protein COB41_00005 [Pseudomonadota bacterium]PCI45926.1 MAG: hypothetical protein COB41_00620 [Pseudomonadota bacterium]